MHAEATLKSSDPEEWFVVADLDEVARLLEGTDESKVRARYEDGVLVVTVEGGRSDTTRAKARPDRGFG